MATTDRRVRQIDIGLARLDRRRPTAEMIADAARLQPASMRPENGEDLRLAARDYAEARAHLAHSGQILAREVANSVDAGMSVAEAARIAGIERHTCYSWIYKERGR